MKQRIRQALTPQIEAQLRENTVSIGPLRAEIEATAARIQNLGQRLDQMAAAAEELTLAQLRARGFHGKMTVHEAWALHPGVREVFTRYHLPHCDRCPVGADERLEEAAFGYSLDLSRLLAELNDLC